MVCLAVEQMDDEEVEEASSRQGETRSHQSVELETERNGERHEHIADELCEEVHLGVASRQRQISHRQCERSEEHIKRSADRHGHSRHEVLGIEHMDDDGHEHHQEDEQWRREQDTDLYLLVDDVAHSASMSACARQTREIVGLNGDEHHRSV